MIHLSRATAAEIQRLSELKEIAVGDIRISAYSLLMPGDYATTYWRTFIELRLKFLLRDWK